MRALSRVLSKFFQRKGGKSKTFPLSPSRVESNHPPPNYQLGVLPLKLSLRLGRLPRSQTSPSVEPDVSTPSNGGVPTTSDRDVELSTMRFFRNPKVQSLSYSVLYTHQNELSSPTLSPVDFVVMVLSEYKYSLGRRDGSPYTLSN